MSATADLRRALLARPRLTVRGLLDRLADLDARHRTRIDLIALDDRMLRDVGLTRADVADELRHIAQGFVHTAKIEHFLHHPKPFPVDIRHNAKIGREKLAAWAAAQLAKDSA